MIHLFTFLALSLAVLTTQPKMEQKLTYLALGDSYTIGEGVEEHERFPNQAVVMLREKGYDFEDPKIIATTGWTTDELQKGISEANIEGQTYDLVTLLIGVNNQYRGRDLDNYREEFRQLLEQAISFAGGKKENVLVLSIPDWGITPFATEKETDKAKVAQEIDRFNRAKQAIAERHGVTFLDITTHYREYPLAVVSDKLHPDAEIYKYWAERVVGEY
ncbi:SGNH/GDSL hydrolase family protein [Litoribacter ruber]|uniref:SGNH/GDSL hydrolase family protein n=1 Tax=Litoribacter ruber TaxID=702568 RepID=UPI001BD94C8D|nr:SGNH/GDSL hydrolase family protein [Litoribacter ruber]MBT0812371.1 SGNH/GDSL hydrolase family protein [Litoribacter ruber]